MLGPSAKPSIAVQAHNEGKSMREYQFALIVAASPKNEEEILDVTDALGEAGCTDASIRGHSEGMEVIFDRTALSLQAAFSSAIAAVEQAGFRVVRLEMDREAISLETAARA
jgi:hypothetical protein